MATMSVTTVTKMTKSGNMKKTNNVVEQPATNKTKHMSTKLAWGGRTKFHYINPPREWHKAKTLVIETAVGTAKHKVTELTGQELTALKNLLFGN